MRYFSTFVGLLWWGIASATQIQGANQGRPAGEAPREGMQAGRWSSAIKQAFGTAYEAYDADNAYSDKSPTAPISKVWFTAAQGVLTEAFWPTADTAQMRDHQFLVSDGRSFLFEERKDAATKVEWLWTGVPAYRITNRDPGGRFVIEKTIIADPDRDVIWEHVRFTRNAPDLELYVLHKPQVSNTPMGNSAMASLGVASADARAPRAGAGLFAWQGSQAQAVISSLPFAQASAAFAGPYDGYQDLVRDYRLDYSFETAHSGSVALIGKLELPQNQNAVEFDVLISFAETTDLAQREAQSALQKGFTAALAKYRTQWESYQGGLQNLVTNSRDNGKLFRASTAVLKASEDKTYAGGFIASPSTPWGQHKEDWNSSANGSRDDLTGGYHLVWPRDLYHVATGLMAAGDVRSGVASFRFLQHVQFQAGAGEWNFSQRSIPKEGAFPQNCWLNGEAYWPGVQMDEVALPIVLGYRLWKDGHLSDSEVWKLVRPAADHVRANGPWSPQERWEENFGASPSNIAAMIAGLVSASELAAHMNDHERARLYLETADSWSAKSGDNLDTWLFTTTGAHGNGRYYERIEGGASHQQTWNPDDDSMFNLANGGGSWREKDVTDGGFLELVRFGVRAALWPQVTDTLPEYDATIRVEVPGIGPGFRRYLGDRYNYDDVTGHNTPGMPWPLLTGERGHYELIASLEANQGASHALTASDPYLRAMEKMATPSHMLPEQVWDAGARAGQPTGSATPLAWAHAEYLRLLRARKDLVAVDQIPAVRSRTRVLLGR